MPFIDVRGIRFSPLNNMLELVIHQARPTLSDKFFNLHSNGKNKEHAQ